MSDEENLSKKARILIENIENLCCASVCSIFEMAIKKHIGKLHLPHSMASIANELKRIGIEILPIEIAHLEAYQHLPIVENHRDPFDKLIIATAVVEKCSIISIDEKFAQYKNLVQVIW